MSAAVTAFVLGLAGGLLGVAATRGFGVRQRLAVGVSLAFASGSLAWLMAPAEVDAELGVAMPQRAPRDGFVSSGACRACHPGQYESWHGSFHRRMTQVATPEAIVAPFDGRVLSERGRDFTVIRQGDAFYVAEVDGDGGPVPLDPSWRARASKLWRVVLTTGSHHLQAFWVDGGEGRLHQFPFVYLVRQERWLANSDSFLQPPPAEDDPLRLYVWSDECVSCHTTGGPWTPAAAQTASLADVDPHAAHSETDTAVTELGVSCEACHGPAEEHVRANRSPLRRYAQHVEAGGDDSIVNPSTLGRRRSSSVCGRCHSIYPQEVPAAADGFRPGDRLDELVPFERLFALAERASELRVSGEYETELSEDERDALGAFWEDGSVRVAGREYMGMIRSGCYLEGQMSCTSCHRMHDGDPNKQLDPAMAQGLERDRMCTQCHGSIGRDVEAHTHHPVDSRGSRCVDCHMPYSSYGLLSSTRGHRMDGPTASGATGRERPNACNLCHLDQSLGWSADHLARWYGQPRRRLTAELEELPAGVLWMLRGDAAQRGVAAWHAAWPGAREVSDERALLGSLAVLMEDPYAAVRQLAATSARALDPEAPIDLDAITRDPSPALRRRLSERWPAPDGLDPARLRRLNAQRDETPTWVSE